MWVRSVHLSSVFCSIIYVYVEEGLGFFDCIHEINQAMGIRIEVSDFQINDPFRKLVEVVALTSE